ncbi:MAG: DUF1194 domain-containing protein [Proteobacteria bacterium]|nr:DUF1194 domain-containing protein [Pseudomonadota bacterium]
MKKFRSAKTLGLLPALAGAVLLLVQMASAQPLTRVDLELVLAVDTSGSVDETEYNLQIEGLVWAFRDPGVIAAIIGTSASGGIAATVVHWSSVNDQQQIVPWTLLTDAASAQAFAAAIAANAKRVFSDSTGIGGVLRYAERLIARNRFEGRRKTIDVSGDGINNSGIPPWLVRDMVTGSGITVNGLAILNDEPHLHLYYARNVIGGAGAFVVTVSSYSDIVIGMRNKLLREISINIAAGPPAGMIAARP